MLFQPRNKTPSPPFPRHPWMLNDVPGCPLPDRPLCTAHLQLTRREDARNELYVGYRVHQRGRVCLRTEFRKTHRTTASVKCRSIGSRALARTNLPTGRSRDVCCPPETQAPVSQSNLTHPNSSPIVNGRCAMRFYCSAQTLDCSNDLSWNLQGCQQPQGADVYGRRMMHVSCTVHLQFIHASLARLSLA